MNERERVLAIKDGDHQVSIDLYNEHQNQVYDSSRSYIATITDAEEAVQDVFAESQESRYLLEEDENTKSSLFIVTRNIVFNKNKKRVNGNLFKASVLVTYGGEGYYNSTTAEEDYRAPQPKAFIDRLINSFPGQQGKCFLLSREESLSYRKVAGRFGTSQKTVEIRVSKALKLLKDKVKRGREVLLSSLLSQLQK